MLDWLRELMRERKQTQVTEEERLWFVTLGAKFSRSRLRSEVHHLEAANAPPTGSGGEGG